METNPVDTGTSYTLANAKERAQYDMVLQGTAKVNGVLVHSW
jgi:hypothetical protein